HGPAPSRGPGVGPGPEPSLRGARPRSSRAPGNLPPPGPGAVAGRRLVAVERGRGGSGTRREPALPVDAASTPEVRAESSGKPRELGPLQAFLVLVAFFGAQLGAAIVIGAAGGIWFIVRRGRATPDVIAEAQAAVIMPAALVGTVLAGVATFA